MIATLSKIIRPDRMGRRVLKWETFSELHSRESWNTLLKEDPLEIDLSGISILGHDGLIWLAVLLLYRHQRSLKTLITLPEDDNLIGFLKYVHFNELGFPDFEIRYSNEFRYHLVKGYHARDRFRTKLSRIQPVTKTNWSRINNSAMTILEDYLIHTYNLPATGEERYTQVDPFMWTMQELVHNITLHGGEIEGNGRGFLALTPPPERLGYLRFCFGDVGPGFQRSISGKLPSEKIENDKDAIVWALLFRHLYPEEGVYGLYRALKWIRLRQGTIQVRTGSTLVVLDLSRRKSQLAFDESYEKLTYSRLEALISVSACPPVPGAHIIVDLRLPKMRKPDADRRRP